MTCGSSLSEADAVPPRDCRRTPSGQEIVSLFDPGRESLGKSQSLVFSGPDLTGTDRDK